jgi:hypothetical protein
MLHVDAKGDTQGSLHIADDVVVTAEGRISVGHLHPQAGIDLVADTPGGALRIQDGTEGEGRVLISDDNGVGSWAPLVGASWFAALYDSPLLGYAATTGVRAFANYANSVISFTGQGSVDKAAGTITLPQTGKYRLTLSVYWCADGSNGRTAPYTTKAIVRANGGERKSFNFWGGALDNGGNLYGVLPTFIQIMEFQAGDVLTLVTDETETKRANNARAVLFMAELLL